MIDIEGAVLAPLDASAGQIPMPAEAGGELGRAVSALGTTEEGPILISDATAVGDEWIRLVSTSSSNVLAVTMGSDDFWMPQPQGEADGGGEIVVTAKPPRTTSYSWDSGSDDGTGGSSTGGDNGGDGGGGATEPNDCRDHRALEAKTAIKNDSNDNNREHGVVIYRGADGAMHKSPVLEGEPDHIDINIILNWITANNIPFSQVTGFVHNHDRWWYGPTNEAAAINRYPSVGDWAFADLLKSKGAGGADGAGFALYVIDPDGDMREFGYGDNAKFRNLDNDEKEAGVALPPETRDDGTAC